MVRLVTFSAVAAVAMFAAGCRSGTESDDYALEVRLVGAPGQCQVQEKQLPCDSVTKYLEDDLHLPPDAFLAVVLPPKVQRLDELDQVADAIKAAGFAEPLRTIEN
jgi:hypothetical protein